MLQKYVTKVQWFLLLDIIYTVALDIKERGWINKQIYQLYFCRENWNLTGWTLKSWENCLICRKKMEKFLRNSLENLFDWETYCRTCEFKDSWETYALSIIDCLLCAKNISVSMVCMAPGQNHVCGLQFSFRNTGWCNLLHFLSRHRVQCLKVCPVSNWWLLSFKMPFTY